MVSETTKSRHGKVKSLKKIINICLEVLTERRLQDIDSTHAQHFRQLLKKAEFILSSTKSPLKHYYDSSGCAHVSYSTEEEESKPQKTRRGDKNA